MVELSSTESKLELKEEMVQALQNDIVVSVLHVLYCTCMCMCIHVLHVHVHIDLFLLHMCAMTTVVSYRRGRESLIRRVASMKS